jgi:hypothetical protein
MKKLTLVALAAIMVSPFMSKADEGMWLPMLIKRLNYADMQKHGLQLTADEIYSVNNSSLKDAIVALNGGSCTAETISEKGLLLTNHHCAFGVIQDNSAPEHDYLMDGFWAMAMKEELNARGMTASYLIEMRDVTSDLLTEISITLSGEERQKAVSEATKAIQEKISGEVAEHYDVKIKEFYEGNEYYAFVYETYRDVRLVGAPPSSIGKYGGDTDNWMWPRHTGDFSLLRVYMGEYGKPADYSETNKPYKPKHFLPVSISGIDKDDYAMIMGYPGSTDRYLSSYGVQQELDYRQPSVVKIRGERLAILKEDMNSNSSIRIQYASKYAQVSNYWKYFIGQQRGLKRLKVYDKKKELEDEFMAWVNKDEERKEIYGEVMNEWQKGFEMNAESILFRTYFGECIFASEASLMAYRTSQLYAAMSQEEVNQAAIDAAAATMRERGEKFYKDFNLPTDKRVAAKLFEMFYNDVPKGQHPKVFTDMVAKSKGDFTKAVEKMYSKSIFTSEEKFNAFLNAPSKKVLDKDAVFQFSTQFVNHYRSVINPMTGDAMNKIENSNRLFVHGLREMNSDKNYYPNANSTMRVTYGNVLDYYPADAVYYNFYTTIEGIMEKEDPNNDEFIVPEKLKNLYEKKDYGQYGEDGTLRICFLTNTDITGGNSGSPVINGKGELIGCAFDGNWEAMSGDIAFEPKLQRTIAVDVRYILFIIDKYAGAQNIIDELKLVKNETKKEMPVKMTPSMEPVKASK